MATTVRALIHVPRQVRRGEVVEIRATIAHPMETGYRPGADGRRVPRDIIRRFDCRSTASRSSPPTSILPSPPTPTSRSRCAPNAAARSSSAGKATAASAERDGGARGDMTRWAGAAAAAALLAVALAACTLAGSAPSLRTATSVGADTRRSGFDDMSAALQAMQRDDTQNPAMLWVQEGEALWARRAGNGSSCAGCHGADGDSVASAAARHPAFDAEKRRPLTLAGRIDRCRQRHLGLPGEGADGAEVLALSAWLAHRARGLPIEAPDDARLAPWRERGEALWRQRMGQLDLACHLATTSAPASGSAAPSSRRATRRATRSTGSNGRRSARCSGACAAA